MKLLLTLGTALEDKRITRQELGSIVKEGKDIFAVWGGGSGYTHPIYAFCIVIKRGGE